MQPNLAATVLMTLVLVTSHISLTSCQTMDPPSEAEMYQLKSVKDEVEKEREGGGKVPTPPPPPSAPQSDISYTVTEEVYFDIQVKGTVKDEPYHGRVHMACFGDITPITCLNFIALAKGHRRGREVLTYNNTRVHRIVRDFAIQMGDVTGREGRSGKSIYGDKFHDENFVLSHQGLGWVAMANTGRDSNTSQFFILLQRARWLDGKHVVFAKVIKGMETLLWLGELETTNTGAPRRRVEVVQSGVVGITSKYQLTPQDVMAEYDIA